MRGKDISFGIIVLLSVLLLLFCAKETVMSRDRAGAGEKKQYYALMEEEYCMNMRHLLDEKGYRNSGITIRWISDGQGTRDYMVFIHHRKIERLDDQGKEKLLRELSQTEFADKQCTFHYEFIKA